MSEHDNLQDRADAAAHRGQERQRRIEQGLREDAERRREQEQERRRQTAPLRGGRP